MVVIMCSFGKRLKEIRKKRGIILAKMADDLNTTEATLSRYENDINRPKINFLEEIADYLNISLDYLIKGESKKTNDLPKELIEFMNKYGIYIESIKYANDKGIPPEDLKVIIDTFEELKPLIDKLSKKQ